MCSLGLHINESVQSLGQMVIYVFFPCLFFLKCTHVQEQVSGMLGVQLTWPGDSYMYIHTQYSTAFVVTTLQYSSTCTKLPGVTTSAFLMTGFPPYGPCLYSVLQQWSRYRDMCNTWIKSKQNSTSVGLWHT